MLIKIIFILIGLIMIIGVGYIAYKKSINNQEQTASDESSYDSSQYELPDDEVKNNDVANYNTLNNEKENLPPPKILAIPYENAYYVLNITGLILTPNKFDNNGTLVKMGTDYTFYIDTSDTNILNTTMWKKKKQAINQIVPNDKLSRYQYIFKNKDDIINTNDDGEININVSQQKSFEIKCLVHFYTGDSAGTGIYVLSLIKDGETIVSAQTTSNDSKEYMHLTFPLDAIVTINAPTTYKLILKSLSANYNNHFDYKTYETVNMNINLTIKEL